MGGGEGGGGTERGMYVTRKGMNLEENGEEEGQRWSFGKDSTLGVGGGASRGCWFETRDGSVASFLSSWTAGGEADSTVFPVKPKTCGPVRSHRPNEEAQMEEEMGPSC